MSLTQRSSARYMARPDATSLQGFYGRVDLDRQSGHLAGGPLSCDPVGYLSDISANTDSRHTRQVRTKCQLSGDDGRGTRWSENLNATLQIGGVQLGSNWSRSISPAESVTKVIAPEATHTFGHRYLTSDPRTWGAPEATHGELELGRDTRALFRIRPENALMVKLTCCWMKPREAIS